MSFLDYLGLVSFYGGHSKQRRNSYPNRWAILRSSCINAINVANGKQLTIKREKIGIYTLRSITSAGSAAINGPVPLGPPMCALSED